MIGNLVRAKDSELEGYLKDSSLLGARIYDDESEAEDERFLDIDKFLGRMIFYDENYAKILRSNTISLLSTIK